jgi:hypothetical protein
MSNVSTLRKENPPANVLVAHVGETLTAAEIMAGWHKYIVVQPARHDGAGAFATIALPPVASYAPRELTLIGGEHAVLEPSGDDKITGDYRRRHGVRLVPLMDGEGHHAWAVL